MGISQYLSKFALGVNSQGVLSAAKGGTGNTSGGGSSSPTITAIGYPGNDTAVSNAGGDTVTLTGTNFNTGVNVVVNGVSASVVTRVSSTQLTFTAPAQNAGSYIIYVVNTDGSTALGVPGLQYSPVPSWTTAAGSLGSPNTQASFTTTLTATGDAPITYSVVSGALPSGITLNSSTGVLSGTAPSVSSPTTYNFTVRSTDAQNQDTDRAFSISVILLPAPTSVTYLVVAGGGGGGVDKYNATRGAGGGGGGGYLTGTTSVTTATTYTVTVGAGGAGGANIDTIPGVSGSNGGNSVFSSITSTGGGGGGGHTSSSGSPASSGSSGTVGGSGGGGTNGSLSTSGINPQGNISGAGAISTPFNGGGGGGAGGAGSNMNGGAAATNTISGSSVSYAGGAGGWGESGYGTSGTNAGNSGGSGVANRGGGGSAIRTAVAGSGGSGIVVIRYPDTYATAISTTGSPTVTYPTGFIVYTFNSSGSITF
jgi:hypothetical protein